MLRQCAKYAAAGARLRLEQVREFGHGRLREIELTGFRADAGSAEQVQRPVAAQGPLLETATMGLPGLPCLAVLTCVFDGPAAGVRLVTWRSREEFALHAGETVERAAQFNGAAQFNVPDASRAATPPRGLHT